MKRSALIAAALALGPVAASAQEGREAQPSAETQEHAITYLRVLYAGLESKEVGEDVKSVLMGCIFSNSLRAITEQMNKAIAASSVTVDRNEPSQLLGVMAGVCGYRPPAAQGQQGAPEQTLGRR
ncbi:hypothetical protein GRI89_04080 [Altererythrobacter salegens]|uniref:Uncharacterized protein n=1 Tax=Croceibacterium salegens TaxID=1737568 RepID=A0A6I4ST67_9SPHN|nr:hypothetical protein [Croceibacterium salegens]MXO58719.1 hypothetical protein [Croceibacterium salegens]